MSTELGADPGVVAEDGLVTYHYEVMRPQGSTDARYIVYLMKSAWFTGEMVARERGIAAGGGGGGVRTTEIHFTVLRTIKAPLPDKPQQSRIADYLDCECSRIDSLIALREEQIAALTEREEAELSARIDTAGGANGWVAIRRVLARIEQGWSPTCEARPAQEGEPGVIKLGSVRSGRFRPTENKAFAEGVAPEERYLLRNGDLLISRANTPGLVGDAAVVTGVDNRRLYLCDLMYRIHVREGTHPPFVSAAVRSRRTRGLVGVTARGTSQSMAKLRGEDIANLLIPLLDLSDQIALSEDLGQSSDRYELLRSEMRAQVDLLRERRRSLITAAVMGEFDVTTAGGRGVVVA